MSHRRGTASGFAALSTTAGAGEPAAGLRVGPPPAGPPPAGPPPAYTSVCLGA